MEWRGMTASAGCRSRSVASDGMAGIVAVIRSCGGWARSCSIPTWPPRAVLTSPAAVSTASVSVPGPDVQPRAPQSSAVAGGRGGWMSHLSMVAIDSMPRLGT